MQFRTGNSPRNAKKSPCEDSAVNRMKRIMSKIDQPNADLERFVDFAHHFVVEMRNFVGQPLFVDRSDLLEKQHGIPVEAMGSRVDFHMRRQFRLLDLGRNGRYDHRRAEAVADIVLNDQDWSHSALFGAYDR